MQENFWKSSVILSLKFPSCYRRKPRNEISHLRSTLLFFRRSLKEEDRGKPLGKDSWGSPMSTQVMPGPLTKHGGGPTDRLWLNCRNPTHTVPLFQTLWSCPVSPRGKASKRLFYSHIFPVPLLSMRSKGDCLEPALYPIRLIYKTEVAVPSPSYHFIQKKTNHS